VNIKNKVAITGIGIISCLGLDVSSVQDSLKNARSGIILDRKRKELGFRSGLTATIKEFNPKSIADRKTRKSLPDFGVWALAAIKQALNQAQIEPALLKNDKKIGIIFGNDSSAVTAVEQVEALLKYKETKAIGSGHIFRLLNSTITLNLAAILNLKGYCWTVSSACASGAMAIGQAWQAIKSGAQDIIICGGAQEISWQSMCSFDALGAFSLQEDNPHKASRPFDKKRDGLVPSGGAAALVLESETSVKSRGVTPLAWILGYGTYCDGYHIAVPNGEGIKNSMIEALKTSGIMAQDIDLIMAHATSTVIGDQVEAQSIWEIFGNSPLVAATKALTGHEFWMAGASQAVYSIIMCQNGFIAPNPNLEEPDPVSAKLNLVRQELIKTKPKFVLCNASGFGGTNASYIIEINYN